jgi:hypothetical protein
VRKREKDIDKAIASKKDDKDNNNSETLRA